MHRRKTSNYWNDVQWTPSAGSCHLPGDGLLLSIRCAALVCSGIYQPDEDGFSGSMEGCAGLLLPQRMKTWRRLNSRGGRTPLRADRWEVGTGARGLPRMNHNAWLLDNWINDFLLVPAPG
jgi:hypothetical protein